MAFPAPNAISFWLTASGALRAGDALVVGVVRPDWTARVSAVLGIAPDARCRGPIINRWSLEISGIWVRCWPASTWSRRSRRCARPGWNCMRSRCFVGRRRAPSSTSERLVAFPVLTATFGMLLLDRYVGNALLHQRRRRQFHDVHQSDLDLGSPGGLDIRAFCWAFVIFSEVIATFAGKQRRAIGPWCWRPSPFACVLHGAAASTSSRWAPARMSMPPPASCRRSSPSPRA